MEQNVMAEAFQKRSDDKQMCQNRIQLQKLIDRLRQKKTLSDFEFRELIATEDRQTLEYLYKNAREVCDFYYGKKIYIRGLIEFTNYCRNNCYYCGIRRDNEHAERYRLREKEIWDCVEEGYALGFRTFVLQGGEDSYYTKERLGNIIKRIKAVYAECAITLSFGEWDYERYEYWYKCGADRYLLRHETANVRHYQKLHPKQMNLSNRTKCLSWLKGIGYQVGAGFMVGSPGQRIDMLVEDLHYLQSLQPHMVGIGPFIPHKETPFAGEKAGTLCMTLKLLAIVRLMLPKVLLPATTALSSIHTKGREWGILAGANVVMPNLSPTEAREKYLLYDHKANTGGESAQCIQDLKKSISSIGYEICIDRGDSLMVEEH